MGNNFRNEPEMLPRSVLQSYQSAAIEELRRHELILVLAKLAARDIHPIVFKGAALAYSIYPLPENRRRSDTDLLIPKSQVEAMDEILLEDGYRRFMTVEGEYVSYQSLYQKKAGDIVHTLDVHWKMSNPVIFSDLLSYDELRSESVSIPHLGPHALAPSNVHSLMIACIHRIAHHAPEQRPEWIQDIHLLILRMSEAEISRFVQLAAARKVRAICLSGFVKAKEDFGTPISSSVLNALKPEAPEEPSAAYLRKDLRRIDLLKMDLIGLPFSKRLRFIWEMLFPSLEYVQSKYPGTSRLKLPYLYARRIGEGLRNLLSTR